MNKRRQGSKRPQKKRHEDRSPRDAGSSGAEMAVLNRLVRVAVAAIEESEPPLAAPACDDLLKALLDIVGFVRESRIRGTIVHHLVREVITIASSDAMTLGILLERFGALPILRKESLSAVRKLAEGGLRSQSEALVDALSAPVPLEAWSAEQEDGQRLVWLVTGSGGSGVMVLSVGISGGKAVAATIDSYESVEGFHEYLGQLAQDGVPVAGTGWSDARNEVEAAWEGLPTAGPITEALYLRPWIDIAILPQRRGPEPASTPVTVEKAPATKDPVIEALRTHLGELEADEDTQEVAFQVWSDYLASTGVEPSDDDVSGWVGAVVMSTAELLEMDWPIADVAVRLGLGEEVLVGWHERLWEGMDVEAGDDPDDDDGDDKLLSIESPQS
jgi:hypothetical protein